MIPVLIFLKRGTVHRGQNGELGLMTLEADNLDSVRDAKLILPESSAQAAELLPKYRKCKRCFADSR